MKRLNDVFMAASKEQYRIRYTMKAEGDAAEVMVYSEIVQDKWFDDEVSTSDFDKALKDAIKGGAKDLNIRINSPGGDVYAAVAMRSMVINAGFDNIRVMIEGLCASAATLFATIPGATVVIAEGSEFMIHNPMTIAWGNAEEIEKTVEHLHKLEEQFHGMYAAKTGQEESQIKEWMDATTWFTAKEAVDYGFCDELLATEKVAACVTSREMALMKSMYGDVPEDIKEKAEANPFANALKALEGTLIFPEVYAKECVLPQEQKLNDVSTGSSVAGVPTEINSQKGETLMELENLTMDQLRDGNPALFAQVQQSAVAAERERLDEIDALTVPGYEEMAAQAKANGTSAMDFHKQIVAARKQKGNEFVEARQRETEPVKNVSGGAPADNRNEEQEIQDAANEIAKYASAYTGNAAEGMF
jgi:ATP-dependent Clp endopeptidase proteolytic subunit ClpP